MKALDPQKHEAEIMVNLDKLQALDFKRVEYYKDLRKSMHIWYIETTFYAHSRKLFHSVFFKFVFLNFNFVASS